MKVDTMTILSVAIALGSMISGCFISNLNSNDKFGDAASRMNDDGRWGRVLLAADHVSGDYKKEFLTKRRGWGKTVQIADMELVRAEVDPPNEGTDVDSRQEAGTAQKSKKSLSEDQPSEGQEGEPNQSHASCATAVSVVNLRWYSKLDMTLHESTLKQCWKKSGSRYLLEFERVVSGNEEGLWSTHENQ